MTKTKTPILLYFFLLLALASTGPVFSAVKESKYTTISLNLVNTFSWTVIPTWSYLRQNERILTSGNSLNLIISATATSLYTITQSWAVLFSWHGTGMYQTPIVIQWLEEWAQQLQPYFYSGDEVVVVTPILVINDTLPPSVPSLTTPSFNELILSDSPVLQRNSPIDTGTATVMFTVHLSTTPTFMTSFSVTTTETSLVLPWLQQGTRFRYVSARDSVWNTSASSISQFSIGESSDRSWSLQQRFFFSTPDDVGEILRSLTPTPWLRHDAADNKEIGQSAPVNSPRVPWISLDEIDALLAPLEERTSEPPYDHLTDSLRSLRQKLERTVSVSERLWLPRTTQQNLYETVLHMEHVCIQEEAVLLAALSPEVCNDEEILQIAVDTTQTALVGIVILLPLLAYDIELQATFRTKIHNFQKKNWQNKFLSL